MLYAIIQSNMIFLTKRPSIIEQHTPKYIKVKGTTTNKGGGVDQDHLNDR